MKVKIFSLALLLAVLSFVHPYGFNNGSLNQGIAIGSDESCQAGFEVAGTRGFFAYCDSSIVSLERFEDSSGILSIIGIEIPFCVPFSYCSRH